MGRTFGTCRPSSRCRGIRRSALGSGTWPAQQWQAQMRQSVRVSEARHGAHAKPGSWGPRQWTPTVGAFALFVAVVVSGIGLHVAGRADRSIWEVAVGVSVGLATVAMTIWKLVSDRAEPDVTWRFVITGVALVIGGFGLALSGGDHPTLWSRLIGFALGLFGLLMCYSEARVRLREQQRYSRKR